MFLLRLVTTLALWLAIAILASFGYMSAASAGAFDGRRPEGLIWVGGAILLGFLVERLRPRAGRSPWTPTRLGVALLLSLPALCAWSHVEAFNSVRVLREEIPPFLAPLQLLWAGLVPIWLGVTARRLGAAEQALLLGIVVSALSGALFLLPGSVALLIAVPVLLLQFHAPGTRVPARALGGMAVLLVLCLGLSTAFAHTPVHAHPSFAWVLSLACLGTSVAVRPRERIELQRLLAAMIVTPLLMALADVALTSMLAQQVSWPAALDTRPTLFRQHPNFLAPFFGTGALLALTLAMTARLRLLWGLAALLLMAATLHTDSRAGLGALLIGLALVPGLVLLRRLGRRFAIGRWIAALVVLGALLVTGFVLARDQPALSALTARLGRFEKSVDYRADAWRNSVALIKSAPLLGIGPGTFISVARFEPGSRFFNEPTSPHPHNVFLYVAQAGGLLALLAFLAWLVLLVREFWRAAERPGGALDGLLALGLLASLLALLSANLLDLGLALETVVPAPLFLLTGLALAAARTTSSEPRRPARAGLWFPVFAVLLGLWWTHGVRPTRAATLLKRAELRSGLATEAPDADELRAQARDDLRAAIALDPDNVQAHDLLARWLEQTPNGHTEAHAVLSRLVDRSPNYGPAHSLLGQFFWRIGDPGQAAQALRRAVDGGHGSVFLRRDRALLVQSLAQLGRRTEAFNELARIIQLEAAIIYSIAWRTQPGNPEKVLIVEGGRQEPIRLVDAVAAVAEQHKQALARGEMVGRRFWMDSVTAFRLADRDDLALEFLDWLEAHRDQIPFVAQQLDSLANERGNIALERHELDEALAQFEFAAEFAAKSAAGHSSHGFFVTQAERVRRLMAGAESSEVPTPESEQEAERAFLVMGEILDQPTALRDNLRARSKRRLAAGDPGGAARLLRRSLLYEDDLIARAKLCERVGELHLAAGQFEEAETAYLDTLEHLASKPIPLRMLRVGLGETWPARLARALAQAWRGQGVAREDLLDTAWKRVPDYWSTRQAMVLWRLEFHHENGRADQLVREADMVLLGEPSHLPAMWARLEAAEALGRFPEVHQLMVELTQRFAEAGDPEQQVGRLVTSLRDRQSDPEAWREVGIARLLQARYQEAAGLFASARALLAADDDRAAARLLGWQARAQLLLGAVDEARALLEEALALDPERGILHLRLNTLPRQP